MSAAVTYRPRNPEENPLYGVIAEHLETFLARQRQRYRNVPEFVEREFRSLGSATIYGEQVRKTRSGSSHGEDFLHIISALTVNRATP